MKDRKVIKYLRMLSSEELADFQKFMESRYHNPRDRAASALLQYLAKFAPDFDAPKMSLERTFSHTFPKQPYKEAKLLKKCTHLIKRIKDYLKLVEFRTSSIEQQFALANAFRKRQADEEFFEQLEVCHHTLDALPDRGLWYHWWKLKLLHERYFHPNTEKLDKKESYKILAATLQVLDHFFVMGKLRYGLEASNRKLLFKDDFKVLLWKEILELARINAAQDLPLFGFYLQLLAMLEHKDEVAFTQVKTAFEQSIALEGKEGQAALSTFLINHWVLRLTARQPALKGQLLALYKLFLSRKTLEQNGYLSAAHFINIGIMGAEQGEFEWTARFVAENSEKVQQAARAKALNTVAAYLAFYQELYPVALEKLIDLEFSDVGDHIRSRVLLLRCFIELLLEGQKMEAITTTCKAFENYLKRHARIGPATAKPLLHFIVEIRQIQRIFLLEDKAGDARERLALLSAEKALVCRNWLQDKYAILAQKK